MHCSSYYFRPPRKGSFSNDGEATPTTAPCKKWTLISVGLEVRNSIELFRVTIPVQRPGQAKYVMTAFNFKGRHEKLAIAGFLLRLEDTMYFTKEPPLQKPIVFIVSARSFVLLSSTAVR